MSFEAQKFKFSRHFGYENLKSCENLAVPNFDFVMRQKLSLLATVHAPCKVSCLVSSGPADAEQIDWGSVARYAVWGFAIFPHILRHWYRFLDAKIIGKSWQAVVKKTVIDQTFFPAPILGSFYLFLSALEGKTQNVETLTEECRIKLGATLKARYCFMLPAQV